MIIIPDIHGRTFWKESVKKAKDNEEIIFLGDYLDPYDFENITVEDAIINFKEIINFKHNRNNVILLIGNHDCYYFFKKEGPSRYSYEYRRQIENIFECNREDFQLAYETENTLFTHSGYLAKWANDAKTLFGTEILSNAESINKLLNNNTALMMVSRERGGQYGYGSCIWADVSEHEYAAPIEKYQIFGHTLQLDLYDYYKTYNKSDIKSGFPIITENYAMLDCRKAFKYNDKTHELWELM